MWFGNGRNESFYSSKEGGDGQGTKFVLPDAA